MTEKKAEFVKRQIENVIVALEKNNMRGFYAKDRNEAREIAASLLSEGDTVGSGGSVTLDECGIIGLLRSGKYNYLDRGVPGLSKEQIREIYIQAFSADVYLCSANAITLDGKLYNVDGNSNRVAALLFGPKSVIVVAGYNKIVPDINAAAKRVKTVAAPCNCMRLNCETFCREKGVCCESDNDELGSGCNSDARICCNYVISAKQRHKDRIKVILVGEELGY
ncbi:MAG TPA: lactate utilization protein [Oscillospiraceae bacterium]|nr:lactate utilization protein [Oscillospiraceae bacterium]HPF55285.1 lactate utilization protein [Clostridiales bacterium]HPK34689.1 lactate utilization protein [Oscillospiraceae bacterium]HPR74547.1 lactate utilization protein [Oscillospiraceae bacterium]